MTKDAQLDKEEELRKTLDSVTSEQDKSIEVEPSDEVDLPEPLDLHDLCKQVC